MTCLWLLLALLGGAQAFRLRMSANTKGVQVRFKNFAVGEADKVVQCNGGDILMDVGDAVGVKIPRGCKTGVCGTCTLDLLDPNFEGQRQTVRACCTLVPDNEDGAEVVVDCSRMLSGDKDKEINPMARFEDGWEEDFKPDYRQNDNEQLYTSTGMGARAPASGLESSSWRLEQERSARREQSKAAAQDDEVKVKEVQINGGTGGILGAVATPEESGAPESLVPKKLKQEKPSPMEPKLRWRSAINGNPQAAVAAEKTPQRELSLEPLLRPAGVSQGFEMVPTAKPRPKLITFDATGTLMQLRSHIGVIYRDTLLEHATTLRLPRPDVFSIAFKEAYASQCKAMPCFGCGSGIASFDWWRPVMQGTYDSVFSSFGVTDEEVAEAGGMESKEEVMEMLFQDLYFNIFAKGPPEGMWELRPGVEAVLQNLRSAESCGGLRLGVLSNFDDRLPGILESLGIAKYFDFVLTSREAGQEKPSQVMFDLARNALGLSADGSGPIETRECLHAGDTLGTDVRGALDAGWQSAFISDIATVLDNEANPKEGMPRKDEYLLMGDLWPILELYDLDISSRDLVSTSTITEAIHLTTELEV